MRKVDKEELSVCYGVRNGLLMAFPLWIVIIMMIRFIF